MRLEDTITRLSNIFTQLSDRILSHVKIHVAKIHTRNNKASVMDDRLIRENELIRNGLSRRIAKSYFAPILHRFRTDKQQFFCPRNLEINSEARNLLFVFEYITCKFELRRYVIAIYNSI